MCSLHNDTVVQCTDAVLRECAIGMLNAGMSTRAVARELNLHFSTISVSKGVSDFITAKCEFVNFTFGSHKM